LRECGGDGGGRSGWQGRGWGQGGEMTQALYAHMNNKTIKKKNTGKQYYEIKSEIYAYSIKIPKNSQ
jgi:hypothetical protein